jgi:D-inositol-3-phosphate glycosyltransferase
MSNYPPIALGTRVHVISLHADPASAAGAAAGGGTHSYLRELLTALPRRGYSISVITRRASAALDAFQLISRSADIFRVQIGELEPVDKRLLDSMHEESLAAVRRAIIDGGSPVRLLHSVYWNSGRVALNLSRELNVPFVHTVISNGRRRTQVGAEEHGERRAEVELQVFAGAFRIFCICPDERDDLVHLYGIDPKKIVVVGRPVGIEFVIPPHAETGVPLLLPPWNVVDAPFVVDTGAG